MRFLFLGLTPPAGLEQVLLTHGFMSETMKRVPDAKDLKGGAPYDLIAYAPKALTNLKDAEKLRSLFPTAWIALVIDRAWLKDTTSQNTLLKCEEKNEIWLADSWTQTFWFSVQTMINRQKLIAENAALEDECRQLKTSYAELSTTSDKLIQQLEKDVGLATHIQRSLMPKVSPQIPGVSISVKYIPAAGAGGDYYDIFEFGDRKRFGVLMADSKTHGMAASLLSVLLKVRLEEMKDRFPDSKSFVEFLNRQIQELHKKDLANMSLLYGILDRSSLTFQYTSAGPWHPLLWRQGAPQLVEIAPNPPLGGMDHFVFRECSLSLKPGDLLILHTDGLDAAIGHGQGSAFDRIVKVLEEKKLSPTPLEVQNELMGLVDHYIERKPLEDDLTLIHFAIDERALYVAGAEAQSK